MIGLAKGGLIYYMSILNHEGRKITVDNDGYVVNYNEWDEDVARGLATRWGINELTAEDIAMLKFIRDHYKKYNFFPIVSSICKNVHEPRNCIAEKFMNPLIAWKVAGLPHPDEPMISLLEAGQSPG
jgi:TusE/DsrC/DsvC family sulfur relay protein